MISFNQIRAYRKTMVSTAEPVELARLLVDSALRYTTQAQDSLKTGRIRQKCEDLARAGQIVTELMNCLDFRRGGEIALTLESLYVFILQKITDANLTNDPGQLDGVIKVLADLSSAWSSISSDSYAGAC